MPPASASPPIYAPRPYASPGRGPSAYPPSPAPAPIAHTPPQFPSTTTTTTASSPYAHRSPYGPIPPHPPPPAPESRPVPAPAPTPAPAPSPPQQPAPTPTPAPAATPTAVPAPTAAAPSEPRAPASPEPTPMDVDAEPVTGSKAPKKEPKGSATAPSSNAPSPKAARPSREAPPPLPQGSGLISNALFGVDDGGATDESTSRRHPSIVLHIPLQSGSGNHIVNFARLAEEQYGFAALHPRLAAHKERLARVAAAGAALERQDRPGRSGLSAGESADEDLSLEMDRESDLDGETGSAAAPARTNGTDAADGQKKRRRKKMEEYDRDDPFVDDSELAWQESAAASKDGYFVYSGPLVPEGEKVQVERADGTIKRGRGRGRGGRSRGPPAAPHQVPLAAASVPISQETGLPLRGPGSRGGSTTRRPRPRPRKSQPDDADKSGGGSTPSQGRGGGTAGRGGGSAGSRSSKTPSMVELAPRPNIAPAPPGPSPLAGSEVMSK
ncbi:HPC2-domain-containing protein [Aspergillus campestris IBT 28561]|uniref:HPC2-domain-containing protein n=1 Tax=Aspergillus campestris (strain IBT 28561) TaxID=1392248 RepID=A0A2I1DCZ1_ASPC2|nr:HPC2-domain-containing protein [Aspergillus campestris IBT 28561]PKY07731.1 HPC2-domain-containing protein [Aspergillus campestris IBT 28561]